MGKLGILHFNLMIPDSQSLKDKRRVLKSLKDRVRSGFNVSVAEIDLHDKWQTAAVGVAMIGADQAYIDASLQKILNLIESMDSCQLLEHRIEFI